MAERILMIVAHPDDETLFGFSDLLNNKCQIICLTQRSLAIRAKQFEEILTLTDSSGVILDYRNSSTDTWADRTDAVFFTELAPLITGPFDAVVSHGADGEYGHLQHKRTHTIAQYIASHLGIPFYDFKSRFNPANYGARHDRLIHVYIADGIRQMSDITNARRTLAGSVTQMKTVLKYKYFFGGLDKN
jgi:LmbE family N-acetylglucosaminyl deacetylase